MTKSRLRSHRFLKYYYNSIITAVAVKNANYEI